MSLVATLTTWIVAVTAVIQLINTISGWFEKMAERNAMRAAKEQSTPNTSKKILFVKNAWGALVGLPLSLWLMYWQVSQPGPPTREFVGIMVALGLYLALNLIALVGFAFAEALRPLIDRLGALYDLHSDKST